jgi:hypothetical protein
MEAGETGGKKYDLVDAIVMGADPSVSDSLLDAVEKQACPLRVLFRDVHSQLNELLELKPSAWLCPEMAR